MIGVIKNDRDVVLVTMAVREINTRTTPPKHAVAPTIAYARGSRPVTSPNARPKHAPLNSRGIKIPVQRGDDMF